MTEKMTINVLLLEKLIVHEKALLKGKSGAKQPCFVGSSNAVSIEDA